MPIIAPGDKILVTGANGFLAVHIVDAFLEKGYAVRGVVRSPGKGEHLKKLFAKYGDKFDLAVVEDITVVRRALFILHAFFRIPIRMRQPGAFDNVLGGISAIAHTASPFHIHADDPNGGSHP